MKMKLTKQEKEENIAVIIILTFSLGILFGYNIHLDSVVHIQSMKINSSYDIKEIAIMINHTCTNDLRVFDSEGIIQKTMCDNENPNIFWLKTDLINGTTKYLLMWKK